MSDWHFHTGQVDAAADLVLRFHYSGRMPNARLVGTAHDDGGLFGDYGEAVAACVFADPPTRWSEDVLELVRLVRRDDADIELTWLIAQTVRWVRRKRLANLLVSFADSAHDHHGGIYQAASWNYHGERYGGGSLGDNSTTPCVDGFVIDGVFVPRRTCNARFGTSSVPALVHRFGSDRCVPHYDEGKHLYWKALSKAGRRKAERLGFRVAPYPKPTPERQEEAA
jgi:hypothetical protein